jgi:hypothetical protein
MFHFVMPPGVDPGDVIAFRLRWSVRSDERVFSQNTPFRRDLRDDYVPGRYGYGYAYGYAYCPVYDPLCFEPVPYGYPPPSPRYGYSRSRVVVRPAR